MSQHVEIHLPLARARRFAWPLPDLWASGSLTDDDLRAYCRFRAVGR